MKDNLNYKIDAYEQEILVLRKKMKESLLEYQKNYNFEMDYSKENALFEEKFNEIKNEKNKLENLLINLRMSIIDQKSFFESELRINEENLIVLKLDNAQLSLELDKSKMKIKNLTKRLKISQQIPTINNNNILNKKKMN